MDAASPLVQLPAVQAAAQRIAGQLRRTPCPHSQTLSAMLDANVFLKFENQQFTASFKERGALHWLLGLPEAARGAGVVAASAGNHAQAVAYHASRLGIPAAIVMPRSTPNAKVEQTRVFGADIHLQGEGLNEAMAFARQLMQEQGRTLVHPYDDERIIAGQGTVGLEILEQTPEVDAIIVPIGGGGLIGGIGVAVKALAPRVKVYGVQMARFAAAHDRFHQVRAGPPPHQGTVAEGIAVKSPGRKTWPLIAAHVADVFKVSEVQVEQAVFTLLEVEKTLAEGAGAAALAALCANAARFRGQNVVVLVSGGNIDMMILSLLLQRGLVRSHRLARLVVEIPDLPGALAELTAVLGQVDSNIVEIVHQRAFSASSVRATVVEVVLQMRGEEQGNQVIAALQSAGYAARVRKG